MADDLRRWVQSLWGEKAIPDELQPDIERLIAVNYIELEHIQKIHYWLDTLRLTRQCARIITPPRTGKSVTCDIYRLLNKPRKRPGRRDLVPVLYMQAPGDCSAGELLVLILELLGYEETSSSVIF